MNPPLNAKAFTLLEIIIVLIVLGAVAALALPRYDTTVEKLRSKEGANLLPAVLAAQKRYQLDNGTLATDISQLDITFPAIEYFNTPQIVVTGGGATIQRNGAAPKNYTLQITANGVISCTGSLCSKLGY
jgi:prepilin-type N-terminal cleavage/methylation domain-containing protein